MSKTNMTGAGGQIQDWNSSNYIQSIAEMTCEDSCMKASRWVSGLSGGVLPHAGWQSVSCTYRNMGHERRGISQRTPSISSGKFPVLLTSEFQRASVKRPWGARKWSRKGAAKCRIFIFYSLHSQYQKHPKTIWGQYQHGHIAVISSDFAAMGIFANYHLSIIQ